MQRRLKPDTRQTPKLRAALPARRRLLAFGLLLITSPVLAQNAEPSHQWRTCPTWPPERPPETVGPAPTAETPVNIESDDMEGVTGEHFIYRGDVILRQGSRLMRADELLYLPDSQQARVHGDVEFTQNDVSFSGDQAHFDLAGDSGVFDDAEFRLLDRHARGRARRLTRVDEDTTLLEDLLYTTCPPGSRDWALNARHMRLDHDAGRGTARHIWLEFKRVPLFYSPWISFPLDDRRKTGLLFPDFGSSSLHGSEFAQPWYWNIAPNMDATLTPHYRSKRGTQLYTETRFLTRTSTGRLQADYHPDDRLYGDDRYYLSYRQSTRLPARWQLGANLQQVSDTEYFMDLDDSPGARARTHLPQSLTLSRNTDWYRFQSRFRIFQTIDDDIDESRLPYRELPDMRLNSNLPVWQSGFHAELNNRFTRFERADSLDANRLHLHPRLTGRFGTPGWFVQPSLGAQYTRYELDNPTTETLSSGTADIAPGESLTLTRSAPIFSLDTGLVLERPFADSLHLRQTLEPRLFYLYVPYRDQSAFPRFDTREMDFTFASLFMEDRFIGPDRLGDANQVGMALTSRILDSRSGRSLVAGSLGQIHHFDDRRVRLGTADPVTRTRSELVGELQVSPTEAFSARTTVLWDPEDRQTQRSAIQFQYRPDPRKVFNLGYRNRRDRLDQADVSFAWPLTDRIRVFGRWNHSLQDDETLDRFAGLEYESCCWAIRFTSRRHVYNRDGDVDRSFMIQLELKGLGGVGQAVDEFLGEGIMGYGYRDYD